MNSIVNWGYQDTFMPVYFFFYENISHAQKASNAKQATLALWKVCTRKKIVPFVV